MVVSISYAPMPGRRGRQQRAGVDSDESTVMDGDIDEIYHTVDG